MKLLLDTHLLIWAAGEPDSLPKEAFALINNPENTLYFSAASIWEIAIKERLGRDNFQVDANLLRRGCLITAITNYQLTVCTPSPLKTCLRYTKTPLIAFSLLKH